MAASTSIPEYTGTALTEILKLPPSNDAAAVLASVRAAYRGSGIWNGWIRWASTTRLRWRSRGADARAPASARSAMRRATAWLDAGCGLRIPAASRWPAGPAEDLSAAPAQARRSRWTWGCSTRRWARARWTWWRAAKPTASSRCWTRWCWRTTSTFFRPIRRRWWCGESALSGDPRCGGAGRAIGQVHR